MMLSLGLSLTSAAMLRNVGPSSYEGLVATNTRMASACNGAFTQGQSRSHHFMRDDVSSIKVVFGNFYGKSEAAPGANTTITASIELPSGVFHQILFSGVSTGAIPNGGMLISDPLTISLANGAEFWIRQFLLNSSSVPFIDGLVGDELNSGVELAASGLIDKTMGGVLTTDWAGYHVGISPIAIIGQTTKPTVMIAGNSIGYGYGDSPNDNSSDSGYIARSIGPELAYAVGAMPQEILNDTLTNSDFVNRTALAQYCSHIIHEYGINDLNSGRTPAQIAASRAQFAANFPTHKIYGCTITPYTTSTDAWATLINQTPQIEVVRVQMNALIRAGVAGEVGFYEIADLCEGTRDSGKWIVSGAANYATGDGIHPSTNMTQSIRDSGIIDPNLISR